MPSTHDQMKWAIHQPSGVVPLPSSVVLPSSTSGTVSLAINRLEDGMMTIVPVDKDSYETALIQQRADAAFIELGQYAEFAHRWDGYHAEPFPPVVLNVARSYVAAAAQVMSQVPKAGAIIPGPAPDGSVDVELRFRDKRLILTIYPSAEGVEVHTYREHRGAREPKQSVQPEALGANLFWLVS